MVLIDSIMQPMRVNISTRIIRFPILVRSKRKKERIPRALVLWYTYYFLSALYSKTSATPIRKEYGTSISE